MSKPVLTERSRRILARARDEAGRFRHEAAAEHVLLALLREEESVHAAVLRSLRLDGAGLARGLDALLVAVGPPLGASLARVVDLAVAEARAYPLEEPPRFVATNHLLAAALTAAHPAALAPLAAAGLAPGAVRTEARRLCGLPPADTSGA